MTNIEVEVEQRLTDESSDDEQHDVTQEETVEDNVKQGVESSEETKFLNEISGKSVRQLSKSEREVILKQFENGVDNPYFKVHKLKNGSMRINKRTNPLTTADKAPEVINNKITKQYGDKLLTNEQLLLEHMFELERRYEQIRLKHKKLKKRYNKLETDLFDDDSDDLDVREVSSEPVDNDVENSVEPVKIAVEDVKTMNVEPVSRTEFRARKPMKPRSWRSVVTSF